MTWITLDLSPNKLNPMSPCCRHAWLGAHGSAYSRWCRWCCPGCCQPLGTQSGRIQALSHSARSDLSETSNPTSREALGKPRPCSGLRSYVVRFELWAWSSEDFGTARRLASVMFPKVSNVRFNVKTRRAWHIKPFRAISALGRGSFKWHLEVYVSILTSCVCIHTCM